MVTDLSAVRLSARHRALAGLATLLTEVPWTVGAEDFERVRAAGVSEEGLVQAITIAAIFNHLTRVADATGVEPDYVSSLPRIQVDASREPVPRPPRERWPSAPAARLSFALRPATRAAIASWGDYMRTPTPALPARARAVVGRAVANQLCDEAGLAAWGDTKPETEGESLLAAFAETLTVAPWRMNEASLAPLRRLGLEDRDLLHVIALVGFQNTESRLRVLG